MRGGVGGSRPARSRLKVGIDARELSPASLTGVSRYVRCLTEALARLPDLDLRLIQDPGPRLLGPHLLMPLRWRRAGVDVLHGPANGLPLVRFGIPGVVTIHDVAIYDHPEWFVGRQWLSTRVLVPRAAARAAIVICPSQATRRGVIRHLHVPEDRCRVIPHGVEAAFSMPLEARRLEALRADLGLPPHYALMVGTVQPRKNVLATLRALASIPSPERVPLVIVGALGWKYEPVIAAVQDLGLQGQVRFLGPLAMAQLPGVYQLADVLAFPSYDEGFGLPVLEAFAAGVPVVAGRRGAIPEVAEGAAILVEPDDHEALAQALLELGRDPALRERLVTAGRERVHSFTWDACARAHADAYRAAAR
ncbi:MAG TPA: glycosyltransferase family 1 protein [Candidatus Limnocylindrales bacterium]|nr:glycosyltransferase family 1 protein [Candidatus Limnocylindrales bacterium]